MTMPIRFPTEAANDPDGKLNGMPESTGEDNILRNKPEGAPDREDRSGKQPPRREDVQPDGRDGGNNDH